MHVCAWEGDMHVSTCIYRSVESDVPGAGVIGGCEGLDVGKGMEHRSSGRAVGALNH